MKTNIEVTECISLSAVENETGGRDENLLALKLPPGTASMTCINSYQLFFNSFFM